MVVGFVFFLGAYVYLEKEIPTCEHLQDYTPPVITRLYTKDLKLMREFSKERRIFNPYESIPKKVIYAFISAEDRRFFYHNGMDFWSIFRATLENTLRGSWGKKPVGASTITQQVAKNFVVGSERSFERKLKEAIVSFRMEEAISKERILELYLNEIYLGQGSYGVAAAALTYFNKKLHDLTIGECAYLASLPKAPSSYDPRVDYQKAKRRRDWIIGRMLEEGYITTPQAKSAVLEKIVFTPYETISTKSDYFTEQVRKDLLENFGENKVYQKGLTVYSSMDEKLQNIADTTLHRELLSLDKKYGYRGPLMRVSLTDGDKNWPEGEFFEWFREEFHPLKIKSWIHGLVLTVKSSANGGFAKVGLRNGEVITLHLNDVKWARKGLGKGKRAPPIKDVSHCMEEGDVIIVSESLERGRIRYKLQQIPEITGGIVIMDSLNGHVHALSGGFSFENNQYNSATQARRQPGSTFKPFVYMAALENGYKENTIINDGPLEIYLGKGQGYYSPKNYTRRSYGPTPLRVGLEQSRNQMTVRLAHEMGMRKVVSVAKAFNLYDTLTPDLAMSLGAGETTLLRLTSGFAMIANGGKKIIPTLIQKIQDHSGRHLYHHPSGFMPVLDDESTFINWSESMNDEGKRPTFFDNRENVVSFKTVNAMKSMLHGAVLRGTARRLKPLEHRLNLKIFAKTGTSNDCKDAWISLFTESHKKPNYVIGVFVGYPIPKSMGDAATGGVIALPIAAQLLKKIYR